MKKSSAAGLGMAVVLLTFLAIDESKADRFVSVPQKCFNSVCGKTKYSGGRVQIKLESQLTRPDHFNFKTNPGAQIELGSGGNYSFDRGPFESGTYSAQACGRSGLGSSICTRWTTFTWRT